MSYSFLRFSLLTTYIWSFFSELLHIVSFGLIILYIHIFTLLKNYDFLLKERWLYYTNSLQVQLAIHIVDA